MTTSDAVPPHDTDAAAALSALGEWSAPEGLSLVEMIRLGDLAPGPSDDALAGDDYTVITHHVPTLDPDVSIPALVCRPRGLEGPVPVLFWIHGGGMVAGNERGGVAEMLTFARELRAAVVSVGYRRAPEHPYPTPMDDCRSALLWAIDQAVNLRLDPERIVVVGGSAGGGLAAGLLLRLRDEGQPLPVGQLLMQPMLDDRDESPSTIQLATWATWNRQANEAGWKAFLGDARRRSDVPVYAAAARASDLSGLPPTFLDVGSTDLFRDEVVAYAQRMWLDGGDCELHVWPGGFHGYENLAPNSGIGRGTRQSRRAWLGRILGVAAGAASP